MEQPPGDDGLPAQGITPASSLFTPDSDEGLQTNVCFTVQPRRLHLFAHTQTHTHTRDVALTRRTARVSNPRTRSLPDPIYSPG